MQQKKGNHHYTDYTQKCKNRQIKKQKQLEEQTGSRISFLQY